ncbi:MAG: hypothetical protein Q8O72_11995 [Bacteroidales bacterium]|nr:hypothetical protein [Bacteroidales bacterium]
MKLKNFVLLCFFIMTSILGYGQNEGVGILFSPYQESQGLNSDKGIFPLLKNHFKDKQVQFPKPYSIGVQAFYYNQPTIARQIRLEGSSVSGTNITATGDSIAQNTTITELNLLVTASVWIFPFLSVYGIGGSTSGVIYPQLTIDGIVVHNLPTLGDIKVDTAIGLDQKIAYTAASYGFGSTLSFGIRKLFFIGDYQFTRCKPSDFENVLIRQNITGKVGIQLQLKQTQLRFWAGVMYYNNDQKFHGQIKVADIAPILLPLLGEEASYSGTVKAISNWNMMIGASLQIWNNSLFSLEAGFIGRSQVNIGYRFGF